MWRNQPVFSGRSCLPELGPEKPVFVGRKSSCPKNPWQKLVVWLLDESPNPDSGETENYNTLEKFRQTPGSILRSLAVFLAVLSSKKRVWGLHIKFVELVLGSLLSKSSFPSFPLLGGQVRPEMFLLICEKITETLTRRILLSGFSLFSTACTVVGSK